MNTEFKGTPGPYVRTGIHIKAHNEHYLLGQAFVRKNFEKNKIVEDVEAIANAQVFATSYELLEALSNMLQFPLDDLNEWANGTQPITITYVPQHIKDALNAINKALGKQ